MERPKPGSERTEADTGFSPGCLDDDTLVARAQDGDPQAFAALVRRYQRPMFALALRLLGDRADAEDAVQEAFIATWRRLPDFRGDAAFSSWLYRIVANRCLSARHRRRPTAPLDGEPTDPARPGESPERVSETTAAMATLRQAVLALPGTQRLCWVLRDVNGMSYPEIAVIVDLKPSTVRGRVQRARTQLAEAMRTWQ